jgi:hypothetical protein
MAFVDDYNAWVTGPSAEANREGIQAIIDRAMEWERRSGATFEGDKTVIIHFTRQPYRTSTTPFTIKGEAIAPKETAKILGVIMDSGLRYVQHIGKATTKGLLAAMALKRLRLVSPSTARQLFRATVAPVVDYASNVWLHACGYRGMALMNRIQRIGAQAVIGAFRTVATAVAEAEASIRTVGERHAERAMKLWVNLRTLPKTNPLSKLNTRELRRFTSPLQRIAHAHQNTPTDKMEVIEPYVIAPWEERLTVTIDLGTEVAAVRVANTTPGIRIATSSSARKGMVGMGGAIHDTLGIVTGREPITYSVTLGARTEQNPYTAELAAMAMTMKQLPQHLVGRQITIITSNRGALLATSQPRHQSGQSSIEEIYEAARTLRKGGNSISMIWIPSQESFELSRRAKEAARQATELGRTPHGQCQQAKSTIINNAIAKEKTRTLPDGVGKYSKEMDTALPGKHTRTLYDTFKRREASVLAQLRTGMARLNGYLHRIGAAESDQCACGQATETVKHFLFRCTRWEAHRTQMLAQTDTRRGNLSFYLGGKAPSDPEKWTPNMDAVRATIKFAIATRRLDMEVEQAANTPQQ